MRLKKGYVVALATLGFAIWSFIDSKHTSIGVVFLGLAGGIGYIAKYGWPEVFQFQLEDASAPDIPLEGTLV